MNPSTSRAAVRSMATLTHATRATPAARNLLSIARPATRSLSSNTRQFAFPRLQTLNKRAFGTTARMVCAERAPWNTDTDN
jgi:fumarate hydratase class II